MNLRPVASLTLLSLVSLAAPAQAEDLQQLQQLLSTRQCQSCNLSRAGLVFANLSSVNLSGANLNQANLNQADLSGATLTRANLIGAVLVRANLGGADLSGADLRGADLREAYLVGADFSGANLDGALLRGAIGIPSGAISADEYYQWGLFESEKGNYTTAIEYYNQTLSQEPNFASAYLARSISLYRVGEADAAMEDATRAQELFAAQGNEPGQQAATQVVEGMIADQEAANAGSGGGSNFLNAIGGIASMLLQFLF